MCMYKSILYRYIFLYMCMCVYAYTYIYRGIDMQIFIVREACVQVHTLGGKNKLSESSGFSVQ